MTIAPPPPAPAPPRSRLPATDVIRRGFTSAVANWPLLLIRIGEAVLFGAITIAAILAVIVPMLVSAGLSGFDLKNPAGAAEAVMNLVAMHWMVLVWAFVVANVLLLAFALVHSFVIAGAARVLVDAEQAAGPGAPPRQAFDAFTMERWLAGGREAWWPVFWIYNLAYGAALLLMLAPAALTLIVAVVLRGSPAAIIAGCLALVLTIFVGLISIVLAGVWCQKAIVVCLARRVGGNAALAIAWREARADAGRHFAVAFVMMVLAVGGVGVISSISMVFAIPTAAAPIAGLIFMPIRVVLSVVQSAFGAAVGNWSLASFAALSE